ncbi:MAG: tetratricopeptide repeat protein [Planctomycetes bacterium]|nr:tetratricopeptide repeat protein [Planctomycetota bacterium]
MGLLNDDNSIQNVPLKAARESSDPFVLAKGFFLGRQYRSTLEFLQKGETQIEDFYTHEPEALLLLGQVHFHLCNYSDAKKYLHQATKNIKSTKLARYYLAKLLIIQGDYRKASELLLSLIADFPEDVSYRIHSYALLATCEMKMGRVQVSEDYRQKAEEKGFHSADLLLEHGRYLMLQESWDEAANYFGEAANVDPTSTQAYFHLAKLFYLHRQFSKAEEILAYGLNNAPEEIDLYMLLGDIRKTQARYEDAIHLYQLAMEINPTSYFGAYITYQLAECYYLKNDLPLSKNYYNDVIKNFSSSNLCSEAKYFLNNLETRNKRGSERIRIENFPLGIPLVDLIGHKIVVNFLVQYGIDITETQLDDINTIERYDDWLLLLDFFEYLKLKILVFRGDKDTIKKLVRAQVPVLASECMGLKHRFIAIIGFDTFKDSVIIVDPDYPDSIDLSWKAFEKSWSITSNALIIALPNGWNDLITELGISESILHNNWIDALKAKDAGNIEEARKIASDARITDSKAETAIKLETEIEITGNNFDEAIKLCDEQLEMNPQTFWAYKYKGDSLYNLEKFNDALKQYCKARVIYNNCPMIFGMSGLCYETMGNLSRAKQCYLRSLEIEPTGTDVLYNRANIYYVEKKYKKAEKIIGDILSIEPEYEKAKILLDKRKKQKKTDSETSEI